MSIFCRSTEDFSYFTLLKPATATSPATSLFGISCTRQMDASQLLNRPSDVTRSTVQKAVVVVADTPQFFGMLREKLSMVTAAWFTQREFTDADILRRFQENLADEKQRGTLNDEIDRDQYLGLNLRELIREFRWQTLVLLKCALLQPKVRGAFLLSLHCNPPNYRCWDPNQDWLRCSSLDRAARSSAWCSSRWCP